jgi:hypothetical protein
VLFRHSYLTAKLITLPASRAFVGKAAADVMFDLTTHTTDGFALQFFIYFWV